MFRKYEKTFRIVVPEINVPGKFVLSKDEQKGLLTGRVEITEKIDGANVAIIRGKNDKWTLQKRSGLADEGTHQQFSFFWNWARNNVEKILQIPNKWIVYGELTYAKHHTFYDMLPSFFLTFNIWNGKEYISHDERMDFVKRIGFKHVPVLHYGYVELSDLAKMIGKSKFSSDSIAEGIVIKNYRKQTRGKLVRAEFVKDLEDEGHWMNKKLTRNKLRPDANIFD